VIRSIVIIEKLLNSKNPFQNITTIKSGKFELNISHLEGLFVRESNTMGSLRRGLLNQNIKRGMNLVESAISIRLNRFHSLKSGLVREFHSFHACIEILLELFQSFRSALDFCFHLLVFRISHGEDESTSTTILEFKGGMENKSL
jgi:hypothetical protein